MSEPAVTVSFRMRESLKTLLEARAEGLGLSLGAIIEDALLEVHGLGRDPKTALIIAICRWTHEEYTAHDFPPDIILEVFKHIQDTPALGALYEEAAASSDGINRQIGKTIKQILNATTGERTKDDARLEGALIDSYVTLSPTTDS